jgi:hypothetical protein
VGSVAPDYEVGRAQFFASVAREFAATYAACAARAADAARAAAYAAYAARAATYAHAAADAAAVAAADAAWGAAYTVGVDAIWQRALDAIDGALAIGPEPKGFTDVTRAADLAELCK